MHYGIAIELRADCQKCGQPVHVNALVDEVQCKGCHTPLRLSWARWKELLEDAFDEIPDYELGRGGRSQSFAAQGNTNILYAHFVPYCFECKTDFDMDEVAAAGQDQVKCHKCHKAWHVRSLPPELETHFPGVELLLAEDETLLPGGSEHQGQAPNGGKPIVFQCPSCSGALRVDGSDRVVDCQYCNASVYLPDDLWFRLHPRDTVRRWFLWWRSGRARDSTRFPVQDEDEDSSPTLTADKLLPLTFDASEDPFEDAPDDELIDIRAIADLEIEPAPLFPPEASRQPNALVPVQPTLPARNTTAPAIAMAVGLGIAALLAGALVLLLL